MGIKNPNRLIINLLKKISFHKFKKKKYLFIIDNNFEYYPIKNTEYYNLTKIYFRYIPFKLFYNFNRLKENYLINIINIVNPKIVISNNLNIFGDKFKKIKPNVKYYFYQHSYIYDEEIEKFRELYKNFC